MKKTILFLTLILSFTIAYSQDKIESNYKRIYKYDVYQKDWALVKGITGNYGIINRNGKEIVPAIYAKIGKFGEIEKDLALVKNIAGFYGFIDKKGSEVIQSIYSRKQIKSYYYKIDKK